MLLAAPALGDIRSNTPLKPELDLGTDLSASGHVVIDFGDDALTVGRAHPMIDPTLRLEAIAALAASDEPAVLLLDVVLGYGADPDPAGALVPALTAARARRNLPVVSRWSAPRATRRAGRARPTPSPPPVPPSSPPTPPPRGTPSTCWEPPHDPGWTALRAAGDRRRGRRRLLRRAARPGRRGARRRLAAAGLRRPGRPRRARPRPAPERRQPGGRRADPRRGLAAGRRPPGPRGASASPTACCCTPGRR